MSNGVLFERIYNLQSVTTAAYLSGPRQQPKSQQYSRVHDRLPPLIWSLL